MTSQTWRQRWLKPLARLLRGETSARQGAAHHCVVLHLEELERRLVPSATVQFSVGAETVNETAGTFSIPVTLTGTPAPTFASGLFGGSGMAFDAAGNLYVANFGGSTVSKVTPGGVVTTFASGFNGPVSLAFDAAGNLYVANYGDSTVSKVTPGGVVSPFASGFDRPIGLAFDAAGNLYVANFFGTTVNEVTPAGVVSPFASGFFDPDGLAFDTAGNLYVANYGDGTVKEVTPARVVSTFASGFPGVQGLAFDASGNLYVTNNNGNTVNEVTPAMAVSTFASFGAPPTGLAFDAAGNLYVTFNGESVSEFSPIVTVAFAQGGTAISGKDYSDVNSSPLVFAPGQTTEDINGFLSSDPGASPTLTFTLSTPSGPAALGNSAANTLSIDEPNPTPTLTSISATSATAGANAVTLTLTGTNFVPSSTAEFNGTPLETFFDSATQLTAVIPGTDLSTARADLITVTNPGPGGGPSNPETFTVNEPLTLNQRFLSHVYLDLLHRAIDPTGMAYWGAMLDSGVSRTNVVLGIEQDPGHEFYRAEVQEVYQQYLHRAADPAGLAGFTNFLAAGNTVEQLIVAVVTDPGKEFVNGQGGGTYQGFLTAFYKDALGRAVDPTGQQAFGNGTPASTAAAILSSNEYHTDLIIQDYAHLLDRGVDPGDQVWINDLNMGMRDEAVIADIIGNPSGEYFNKMTP